MPNCLALSMRSTYSVPRAPRTPRSPSSSSSPRSTPATPSKHPLSRRSSVDAQARFHGHVDADARFTANPKPDGAGDDLSPGQIIREAGHVRGDTPRGRRPAAAGADAAPATDQPPVGIRQPLLGRRPQLRP